MADTPPEVDSSSLPQASAQRPSRFTFQAVWLIPLVSALIGGWLAVKAVLERGPVIQIMFSTAEGLEAGKTKLKYKDVEIGMVTAVTFTKDLKRVVATAELVKQAEPHLVEDTRFWVVRPRISGGSVSGLGTLLSGSYVAVDIGRSDKRLSEFVGLDVPPVVTIDTPGTEFTLRSANLASVDNGSPVFFRRLQAGQVTSYALNEDGNGVTMKVFVHAPYDKYVNANTRFWNASGIGVKISSEGIAVETESLVSILIGGIAFETPEGAELLPVGANATFQLFASRAEAFRNPETDAVRFTMLFKESARGLAVGAPVDFRGIVVGDVVAVDAAFDPRTQEIVVAVDVNIYPSRMRARSRGNEVGTQKNGEGRRLFVDALVARGLRAQLRTGSLLTGQLYVALDFFPQAVKASVDWGSSPYRLPTVPGTIQELQSVLASVAGKLNRFPLDDLGKDMRTVLGSADRMLVAVHKDVTPELRQTLQSGTKLLQRLEGETAPELRTALVDARKALASADRLLSADAPLQSDTREAMREIARAAHSMRLLANYLEQNPQALLLGKKEDALR